MANFRSPETSRSSRKIFWIGVIFATLTGVAIRNTFDPRRLDRWVLRTLKQARADAIVKYDRVDLSLSHAGLPSLALRVTKLVVESKSPCAFVRQVSADELYLPISIWGLVQKDLRIGVARIQGGRVQLVPTARECGHAVTQSPSQASTLAGGKLDHQWISSVSEQLSRLRQNWPIEGLRLTDVVWMWESEKRPLEVRMNYFQVRQIQGHKPILWDGMAHLPEWLGVRGLPRLHLEGEWSENKVEGFIRGHWKEGSLGLQVRLDSGENQKAYVRSNLRFDHLPMAPVNQVLARIWNLPEIMTETRPSVWMSCEADFESPIEALGSTPLTLKPCVFQGDLGTIRLTGLEFENVFSPLLMGNLQLEFEQMPLSYARDVMGWNFPVAGIGSNPGWVEGKVFINPRSRDQLRAEGIWHDFSWSGTVSNEQKSLVVQSAKIDVNVDRSKLAIALSDWKPELSDAVRVIVTKRDMDVSVQLQNRKNTDKQYIVYDWRRDNPRVELIANTQTEKRKKQRADNDLSIGFQRNHHHPWALVQWLMPSVAHTDEKVN